MKSSPQNIITVATCTLNQWSMDFDGNLERIQESCHLAKQQGATYRLGPELEICGYGCEDHYYEIDTMTHSWQSLIALVTDENTTSNLLCDFGMPLLYQGCRYNCRILCYNHRILLIRPKSALADDGNYRESRYFTAYTGVGNNGSASNIDFPIPVWVRDELQKHTLTKNHPSTVPFGTSTSCLRTDDDIVIGCESCEELWTPQSTHIQLALQQGCEIIGNGSGSHHQLRKLEQRLNLIVSATSKSGGIYLYSNQRGCDGGRLYYDGCALIVCNGQVLAQSSQFALCDVDVITATIDIDEVRSFRASLPSFGIQAVHQQQQQQHNNDTIVNVPSARLLSCHTTTSTNTNIVPSKLSKPLLKLHIHTPEEECCLGPACWLWDYLRRSGASGYCLPLSGGADSAAVATIVMAMCTLVFEEVKKGVEKVTEGVDHQDSNEGSYDNHNQVRVLHDLRRICGYSHTHSWVPVSSQDIANFILHTIYMGTSNSSHITTSRALRLGKAIGCYHLNVPIDRMVSAVIKVFSLSTGGLIPQFTSQGGSITEDLALQNIQARLRMVTAYLFAQLLPWVRSTMTIGGGGDNSSSGTQTKTKSSTTTGFLLVLGSSNVDEGLRGYMTKYDCSSADLNPIGSISKGDLKAMLGWAAIQYHVPVLGEIAEAPPTAELRPIKNKDNDNDDGTDENETNQNESTAAATAVAEHSQLDEEEMGMSYEELGWFGRLRKLQRCGPVSMYQKLVQEWTTGPDTTTTSSSERNLTPLEVATKVKRFFLYYAINRHKMCTLTPSYHAEGYSPDDNRYDLRPFLYNTKWTRQFHTIDQLVEQYSSNDDSNTTNTDTATATNHHAYQHQQENKFLEP